MQLTEANTIQVSIGLLVIFAGVVAGFVTQRNKITTLEKEVKDLNKQVKKLFTQIHRLTAWRERVKGASSMQPVPAPTLPRVPTQHLPTYSAAPEPGTPQHVYPGGHTPVMGVPFRVHDTGNMKAYEDGDFDPEDSSG